MKFFKTILFCFISTLCFSQLKIVPSVGLSFHHSRMISEKQDAISKQTFVQLQSASLSLEKEFNRFDLGLRIIATNVGLSARHHDTFEPNADIDYNTFRGGSEYLLNDHFLFGIYANYHWKDVGLFKVDKIAHPTAFNKIEGKEQQYRRILRIKPTIGLFVTHVQRGGWDNSGGLGNNEDTLETTSPDEVSVSLSTKTSFEVGGPPDYDDIVKNFWGVSLQVGVKFQLRNNNKDRLQLALLYNQGFADLVEANYSPTVQNNTTKEIFTATGRFASRGSYFSIMASYPITIVNKKGERRKDK